MVKGNHAMSISKNNDKNLLYQLRCGFPMSERDRLGLEKAMKPTLLYRNLCNDKDQVLRDILCWSISLIYQYLRLYDGK